MINEEEEWSADFLDEVIQVAELALSSSSTAKPSIPNQSSQFPNPTPFPPGRNSASSSLLQPPLHPHPFDKQRQPQNFAAASTSHIDYSPPRELSQRPIYFDAFRDSPDYIAEPDTSAMGALTSQLDDFDKDIEIERLKHKETAFSRLRNNMIPFGLTPNPKAELERSLNKRTELEQQCANLRKERDQKAEQLKHISSQIDQDKVNGIHLRKSNLKYGASSMDDHDIPKNLQSGVSLEKQVPSTATEVYSVGVQTDNDNKTSSVDFINNDILSSIELSQKLLAIWGSPTDIELGRNVISELLLASQKDFHVLFGYMSINLPSKISMELLADASKSGKFWQHDKDCVHTPAAAKVSVLYSVLIKVINGMETVDMLLKPLLDLCSFQNESEAIIVHSSLRILHFLLEQMLILAKDPQRRDRIIVEQHGSGISIANSHGLASRDVNIFDTGCGLSHLRANDSEALSKKGCWNYLNQLAIHVDWISLFEAMLQITTRISEERVRVEAVSVMNLILVRNNAHSGREKFCQVTVFQNISQLLQNDAGVNIRKHALKLLYLLLNCPKGLVIFCSGCKGMEDVGTSDDVKCKSDFQIFSTILQGIADCLACNGNEIHDLKLQKFAILVLAFLSSSGAPGFEIFIGCRLSRGGNFLMTILGVLASASDVEAGDHAEPPMVSRERILLVREILILLNRLVSNPSYSAIVLRGLTNSRDIASLTIDLATCLSRSVRSRQQDSIVKYIKENEILELAQVFKKRIFTYLGDNAA